MGALETDSFKNQINEVKLLWTEHIEKCKKFSISIIDNDLKDNEVKKIKMIIVSYNLFKQNRDLYNSKCKAFSHNLGLIKFKLFPDQIE